MKTYKIVAGLTMLLMTACESFLDVEPTDRYAQQDFWKTSDNAQAALTGTYNILTNINMYGNIHLFFESISPNGYNYNNIDGFGLIARGAHDANAGIASNRWSICYAGIGRANTLLANIDKVAINAATKKQYKGEARFLRALYYFNLWSLYGGVPLILDAPDLDSQANLPRNSANEVLNSILLDLDSATVNLPKTQSEKGRATTGAALALKARALLYSGNWAKAAAAANGVINLNVYSLFADYRGLFLLENEGNSEIIFDVQFKFPEFAHGFDIQLDGFNGIAPLQGLVSDYYMTDGWPIGTSPLYNAAQPFANRDSRLLATIMYPGSKYKGATVGTTTYPQTGYGFKKFTIYQDNLVPSAIKADGQSELNYIVLRYADVLLMYAEAQNENAGPDASVYNALNLIRQRAKMPTITQGLTKDQMRAEIRHERRIELAGESLYYFDILRWRTAETVMKGDVFGYQNKKIETRSFNPARDYLWPIPSVAIQKNGKLDQNFGFGK
jgi:starch-binding outer membrane protein, SusD/RagB family